MKRTICSIPLDLLKLDQENVRFGRDTAQNQKEAIELMMADREDARKIAKLAKHIATHGLDPTELQLVVPDTDGSYIVLEGNRRLTALKLLKKPDLCPVESLVKDFLNAYNLIKGNLPKEIICSIVPSREEGNMWVELKHTGQNDGIGRVNWDSDIRDERRARQTGIESIGRQIRNIIINNQNIFSNNTAIYVSNIPVTTLTRLFASKPAQDYFKLKIINKEIVPEIGLEFIAPSLEFAIELFIRNKYNVNDIRKDDDRRLFIQKIDEKLDPSILFSQSKEILKENTEKEKKCDNKNKVSNKGRIKSASKLRKYLCNWVLKIDNPRINDIYRELRYSLVVDKTPNATAVTFRVFIEVSCDHFIEKEKQNNKDVLRYDNRKILSSNDKLSIKVQSVATYLYEIGLITKEAMKTINTRAGSKGGIGSIDHFNQFVHSSTSKPIPSELKDIAEEYKPLLMAIWL